MPLVLAARFGEAVRVEALGIGPQFWQAVVHPGPEIHVGALGDVVAEDLGVPDGPADAERQWCHHPQALIDHQIKGLQLVERVDVQRTVADPGTLVAAALLPLRVGSQVIGHGGQGRGRRVVRGHHQEDHVIDDVGVGEAVAVVVGGVAQHSQHVGARRGSPRLHALKEVILQHLPCLQPAPPLERRNRRADDRPARAGGGGERPVDGGDQFAVAAGFVAHEDHRGDVEGEFLDRG